MAKPKPKNKQMTIEDFAIAIQRDLARMATKDDFARLAVDIRNVDRKLDGRFRVVYHQMKELRTDVSQLNGIMVSKAELAETLRRELDVSPFAKESDVQELAERLAAVEQKLGIKHTHRAA